MSVAFCITMYDESDTVQQNIDIIRNNNEDDVTIIVQSDSGLQVTSMDSFYILPNLGNIIDKYKVAANAVTRNYSCAFNEIYNYHNDIDYIVALTGDTLISDIGCFDKLYKQMISENKIACVSQAINQDFHAHDSKPPEICGGRLQHDGISDFMPQFFMIDGSFAYDTKVFSTINITNEYCSEQCLGDELMNHVTGTFRDYVLVMSKSAYGYESNDSIFYHRR